MKTDKSTDNWTEGQKIYKYGTLVIFPPPNIVKPIDKLRKQYDPASHAIGGAHITLTQPFLKQPTDNDFIKIKKIVSRYSSFSIHVGPLNNFLPYPCIYYEIHPVDKVLGIRHAMHDTGLFNLSLPHTVDFVPHMSITNGYPGLARTKEIFQELSKETTEWAFNCCEISYMVPNPDFHFEVVSILPLHYY